MNESAAKFHYRQAIAWLPSRQTAAVRFRSQRIPPPCIVIQAMFLSELSWQSASTSSKRIPRSHPAAMFARRVSRPGRGGRSCGNVLFADMSVVVILHPGVMPPSTSRIPDIRSFRPSSPAIGNGAMCTSHTCSSQPGLGIK